VLLRTRPWPDVGASRLDQKRHRPVPPCGVPLTHSDAIHGWERRKGHVSFMSEFGQRAVAALDTSAEAQRPGSAMARTSTLPCPDNIRHLPGAWMVTPCGVGPQRRSAPLGSERTL
jgi:hypothetical protein